MKNYIEEHKEKIQYTLINKKAGEEVTLNLKFPENYVENLKGKDVKFDVKINEVKERVRI